MRIIIEICLLVNCFGAGYYLGDSFNTNLWKFLLHLLLGAPYYVLYLLAGIWMAFWLWLDTWTYLPFWWGFYITRDFDKMDHRALANINRRGNNNPPGRKKRRWEYVLKLVNKRNNYTWEPEKSQTTE